MKRARGAQTACNPEPWLKKPANTPMPGRHGKPKLEEGHTAVRRCFGLFYLDGVEWAYIGLSDTEIRLGGLPFAVGFLAVLDHQIILLVLHQHTFLCPYYNGGNGQALTE